MSITEYINAVFEDTDFQMLDRSTGYHPLDSGYFHDLLLSVIEDRNPQTFVDLGSGAGFQVGIAAHYLGECHGFEINRELTEHARAFLKKNTTHTFGNSHIHNMSYIPEEYRKRKEEGMTHGSSWEQVTGSHPKGFINDSIQSIHNQGTTTYPVDLSEVDVFYAYVWKNQIAQVLEIFKENAKPEAIMIIVPGGDDLEVRCCACNLELDSERIQSGSFRELIPAYQIEIPNHTAQSECASYQHL